MTRLRVITSGLVDGDVRAHIAALRGLATIDTSHVDDALPLVLAAASRLRRQRRRTDAVVTFGEAALRAASFGWRGTIVHGVTARPTRDEASLARRLARRGRLRIVTASEATRRWAGDVGCDERHVHLVRPDAPSATPGRPATRERLGIAADAPVAFVPGPSRPGETHRLALWASGILAFRDPAFRVIVRGGGNDGFLRRFAASVPQRRSLILDAATHDGDLAAAADVALLVDRRLPPWTAVAALAAAGTPTVGLAETWRRERPPMAATLVDVEKPRLVASAALRLFEGNAVPAGRPLASPMPSRRWDAIWNELLADQPS